MRYATTHLLLALVFALSTAGCSRKEHVITGYDTEVIFVADDEYSDQSKFQDLTRSGWEIKSSRRAWRKHAYHYDEKQWGTEYTLQKAIYDNATPRTSLDEDEEQPVTAAVQQEAKEKINPAVDSIHGFASFTLGAPSSEYSSRVEIPPEDPLLPKVDNVIEAKVVQYRENEREWATFPVQEVVLRFEEGVVSVVRVRVAPELGFSHAFEIKYGKPTSSTDLSKTWQGNDTEVDMYLVPSLEYWDITITSKKVQKLCADRTNARFQKEGEALEKRAREAAQHFSDTTSTVTVTTATPTTPDAIKHDTQIHPENIIQYAPASSLTNKTTAEATSAPPMAEMVTLTKPVSVQLQSGTVTLPAGTKLEFVSQVGPRVHVRYLNSDQMIPISATDLK
jgi:hypothetical protein